MEATFLGTGSAMPTGDRYQTGILIQADTTVLIDCGSGVLHRLAQTEPGYEAVDTVLLTHHHLDHVADLLPLMKARWLAGTDHLTVIGPDGTTDLVTSLLEVHEYMQDRIDLTLRDIETGSVPVPVPVPGFDVSAMPTRHSMPCFAYRFQNDGSDFTFSGDSEAFRDLIDFADHSAVLAHDCSFPDDIDVSNHPTPKKLGHVLEGCHIDRVYLTHLYPHTRSQHQAMLRSIQGHYDGDVRFAHDGLTISLSADTEA